MSYQGTTLLGADETTPYRVDWVSPPDGAYTLRAVATDDDGLSRTSAPVIGCRLSASPCNSCRVPAFRSNLPLLAGASPAGSFQVTDVVPGDSVDRGVAGARASFFDRRRWRAFRAHSGLSCWRCPP